MNKIKLAGTVLNKPEYSHSIRNKDFYQFFVSSKRNNEKCDVLRCVVSESLAKKVKSGEKIKLLGEIRTYNKKEEKIKLMIYIFVFSVEEYEGKDENFTKIVGYICKDVVLRKTPLKKDISDFIIASRRIFNRKSDYIPCISWEENAFASSNIPLGTKLVLEGKLRSREYEKILGNGTEETRIAYEVSINKMDVVESEVKENESRSKENL